MIDYTNTADELALAGCDTAILPIGALEQHGPHLPMCTDYMVAKSVAEAVAERLNAYLLPTLPISTSYEHKGKKGSVWMRAKTFYSVIQDIVLNLKEQGFSKVVVMLGHGGIFVSTPAIRELNADHPDLRVAKVDFLQFLTVPEMLDTLECRDNLHACEYETSLMLYLAEEMVKKDKIDGADFVPDVPRDFLNYSSIVRLSKTGVWGKPSLATKEKGEKVFQILVEESLKYIDLIFSQPEGYFG